MLLVLLCRWRFCCRHAHSCWWPGNQWRLARRWDLGIAAKMVPNS